MANRPISGRTVARWFGILALSCAVFAWGLQYKLSLYDAHPSNSIPVAKLLPGKSDTQSQIQQVTRTQIKPVYPELHVDFLVSMFGLSLLGLYIFQFQRSVQISLRAQFASLNHFSFRPPPFIS